MGVIEAVKKGFTDAIKLKGLILIFFVFNILISLISLPMTNQANAGNPAVIALSVFSSIIFFLGFIFLQGGAMGVVKDLIKSGSANLSAFSSYGKTFYSRILMLLLIYFIIAIAVVLVMALISTGLLLLGDNVVIRSIVALLVTVTSLAIITFLVYPIYGIVVDNTGAVPSLKNGIAVAKSNFVKTLGLFLAMLIISLVISIVIGALAGIITVPLGNGISRVVLAFINSIVQSFIPIVMMIAFMRFYISCSGHSSGDAPAT